MTEQNSQHRANLKRFALIEKHLKQRNAAIDERFNKQDVLLELLPGIAAQTKATNGRVTKLETTLGPIDNAYQKIVWLICGVAFIAPFAVTILDHVLSHVWK